MKILLVTSVDAWTRSVSTIHKWIDAGRSLGHDIAVYGETDSDLPNLRYTTDLSNIDLALFAVQVPSDFPDMPYLARVLDGIPKEKRAIVDLWGRYNETIRVEHDFNHLEKLDGHQAWEWQDAIAAVSKVILQPALSPKREGVKSFLFHGFDEGSVEKKYTNAADAVAAWKEKPYGAVYVGSNWQRWHQVRAFLDDYGKVRNEGGPACLIGWDWGERPDWAAQKAIMGVDTDPALLAAEAVEVRHGVRFDESRRPAWASEVRASYSSTAVQRTGLRYEPNVRGVLCGHYSLANAAGGIRRENLWRGGNKTRAVKRHCKPRC
jgi:hypothetical protein